MEATLALGPQLLLMMLAVVTARVKGAIQHGTGVGQRVGWWCIRGDIQLSGSWSHALLIAVREEFSVRRLRSPQS